MRQLNSLELSANVIAGAGTVYYPPIPAGYEIIGWEETVVGWETVSVTYDWFFDTEYVKEKAIIDISPIYAPIVISTTYYY